MKKVQKMLTKEFLIKEYVINKKSYQQIAKMTICSKTTIGRAIKNYKIKIRNGCKSHTKWDKILTKSFLYKEYIKNKKSTIKIAKEIGCNSTTICNYLKQLKISIRTQSEAMKGTYVGINSGSYIDGRKLKIYYCKEKRCNNIISYNNWRIGNKRCQSCRQINNRNNMYGKIAKHGKGQYYKQSYMRSSYEISYAKYCIINHIKYRYEPKAFGIIYKYESKKKEGTYRPDFYLPELDLWIEIKGWWRGDGKAKFNAFKRQYPEIKIKVLMKPELLEIGVL